MGRASFHKLQKKIGSLADSQVVCRLKIHHLSKWVPPSAPPRGWCCGSALWSSAWGADALRVRLESASRGELRGLLSCGPGPPVGPAREVDGLSVNNKFVMCVRFRRIRFSLLMLTPHALFAKVILSWLAAISATRLHDLSPYTHDQRRELPS